MDDQGTNREGGGMSLFGDDQPVGPWFPRFTFVEDLGCGVSFIGFVLFVIIGTVLWNYLFN
jgi:hypothetical protein